MDKRSDKMLYGRRPVIEAIEGGVGLREIWIAVNARASLKAEVASAAKSKKCRVREVPIGDIQRRLPNANHQGVVGFLIEAEFQYVEVEDILLYAAQCGEKPLVAVLDEITDPHNLGAILRSADCAGFHGIVVPKHHAAQVNATVMKTSAGAAAHLRIAQATNLVRTMEEMKEAGLWIFGADMDGEKNHWDADLTGPTAIVIGSEGRGMRRLVSEHCDVRLRIPVGGKIQSLNASVAAGILFFEAVRQRSKGNVS